jgi:hypothetical protein
LESGTQALAVVTDVRDTGVTVNNNPRVKLTLQVQPEGQAGFETTKTKTVSRVSIPSIGDRYYVRFSPDDPSKVEFDEARVKEVNQAAKANVAEAAASAVPPDLAASGMPGRATIVDVQKSPTGALVDCAVTVSIRLIDGTPPYQATCHISVAPDTAARLIPHQTFVTVRADPQNHQRVALSLTEPTPVVTITDSDVIDPPERALREGEPCRAVVLLHQRQWLKTPAGDELYATKVRVTADGSEFQIFLPVPAAATALLQDGKELPAKRLAAEPNVLTVDWPAALAEG